MDNILTITVEIYRHKSIIIWHEKGDELKIIECITTSHQLARELLNRPDDFITAISDDGEYVIGGLKRVSTHANIDDSVTHLALKLKRCEGNMIRWH